MPVLKILNIFLKIVNLGIANLFHITIKGDGGVIKCIFFIDKCKSLLRATVAQTIIQYFKNAILFSWFKFYRCLQIYSYVTQFKGD